MDSFLSGLPYGNILIAGCGGGYDVFVALPLYFALREQGRNVHLANFSFTSATYLQEFPTVPTGTDDESSVHIIDAKMHPGREYDYFPEYQLSHQIGIPVYAIIDRQGCVGTYEDYRTLVNFLDIDIVILADGGCDSILTGSEEELATPVEDAMSMSAVSRIMRERMNRDSTHAQRPLFSYLLVVGTLVDCHEGVKREDIDRNIAEINASGGLITSFFYEYNDRHVPRYISTFLLCNPHHSIVNASIISAIAGFTGNYRPPYLHDRIPGQTLPIEKEMSHCYVFDLTTVVSRNKYLHLIEHLNDSDHIDEAIIRMNRRLRQ